MSLPNYRSFHRFAMGIISDLHAILNHRIQLKTSRWSRTQHLVQLTEVSFVTTLIEKCTCKILWRGKAVDSIVHRLSRVTKSLDLWKKRYLWNFAYLGAHDAMFLFSAIPREVILNDVRSTLLSSNVINLLSKLHMLAYIWSKKLGILTMVFILTLYLGLSIMTTWIS